MTIPNYITSTDISSRLTPEAYIRWFSRSTAGTLDAAFVALCIDDACSLWNTWMGDALAGDWTANGGVVDNVVKRHLVNLSLYLAADMSPRVNADDGTSGNPFKHQYDEAKAYAKELRQGHAARLITAAVVTPRPQGGIASVGPGGNADDSSQSPFVREANGSIYTGF
jgi:hypothetical protein